MIYCRRCHDPLSLVEEKQYRAEREWATQPSEPICDDCFAGEDTSEANDNEFSDADPGL